LEPPFRTGYGSQVSTADMSPVIHSYPSSAAESLNDSSGDKSELSGTGDEPTEQQDEEGTEAEEEQPHRAGDDDDAVERPSDDDAPTTGPWNPTAPNFLRRVAALSFRSRSTSPAFQTMASKGSSVTSSINSNNNSSQGEKNIRGETFSSSDLINSVVDMGTEY